MIPNTWKELDLSYIRLIGNPHTHEVERELVILLPVGCYWAKKHGACSYCGYQPVIEEFHQFFGEVDYLEIIKSEINKQKDKIDRISFFVGGSFLEIKPSKQVEIFEYIDTLNISTVFIETRPELVTDNNVKRLREILHNKEFMVAIGLESSDSIVRNQVHNKGISEESFLKAVQILNEIDVHTLVYVFFKPPIAGMTDYEAYQDALGTIKYVFDIGVKSVEIESGYIVENSVMADLYEKGEYQTLSLWSIFALMRAAIELDKDLCRLAYFSDTPEPIAIPENCPECTQKLYAILQQYRETLDKNLILNIPHCACYEDWKEGFE